MKKKVDRKNAPQPSSQPKALTLEALDKVAGGNGTWGEFPQWASPPPTSYGGGYSDSYFDGGWFW